MYLASRGRTIYKDCTKVVIDMYGMAIGYIHSLILNGP